MQSQAQAQVQAQVQAQAQATPVRVPQVEYEAVPRLAQNVNDIDPAVRDSIGWAATIVVVFFFLAPWKNIWGRHGVFQTKTTVHLATGLPYFATFFNCVLWVSYTVPLPDQYVQLIAINAFGAIMSLSYFATFWYYATPQREKRVCLLYFCTGMLYWLGAVGISYAAGSREIVGYAASVVNVLMYYSPLAAAGQVVKSRSVAKMPFLPLIFGFFGGTLWTAYGVYTADIPVILPNACGVFFTTIQLIIYCQFRDARKKNDDLESQNTSSDLSQSEMGEEQEYRESLSGNFGTPRSATIQSLNDAEDVPPPNSPLMQSVLPQESGTPQDVEHASQPLDAALA